MDFDPPFLKTYKNLLQNLSHKDYSKLYKVEEEMELPLIDLRRLNSTNLEIREKCMVEIVEAARQWGFFQVVNHGVSEEALKSIRYEQEKLFHQPFEKKVEKKFILNIPENSYRWGNPKAFCLRQLSWSEAFHFSIADISRINEECKSLRLTMEKLTQIVSGLAKTLAEVLAQNLGLKPTYLKESCPPYSSYLRLNRYPPCPYPSKVFGLLPHTDSDFLTIVYQDQVGGLQLLKDGNWLSVKPNPEALVINIGDLFQALSNGVYKSIKHRVVGAQVERFSAAYFFCPSNDTIIESCSQPAVYREFSFREYNRQVERDVQETGDKIGLENFLQ